MNIARQSWNIWNTIDSQYIGVEYNMILNTVQQPECLTLVQTLNFQKSPYLTRTASYGVSFVSLL